MGPEEAAALGAKTARVRGKKAAPELQAAAKRVKAQDLDDPETQSRIEFPPEIPATLRFNDGTQRKIIIKGEFSLGDIHDRNIFEDLESYYVLVLGEINEYCLDGADALSGFTKPHLLRSALTSSLVRNRTRRIIAKIARYEEPWTTKDENGNDVRHVRPTPQELAESLTAIDHKNLAEMLIGFYTREVERQKNVQKAAAP